MTATPLAYRSGFCSSGFHPRCRGEYGNVVCDCPCHAEPEPGLRIGSLFSGYGGLEQGVQAVLGGTTAWHSEIDPGACKILAHRYPDVPNLGDITSIDWSRVEPVDVLVGGFPCQDVSSAGLRKGLRPDTRSGLWAQFAHAINQLRPPLVVIENVRGLLSAEAHCDVEPCPWCVGDADGVLLRALGAVLGDLADIGYDASWQGVQACDVGAPHERFRAFVVAWPAAHADGCGQRPDIAHVRAGQPDPDRRATAHSDRGALLVRVEPGMGARRDPHRRRPIDWGIYTAAIRRWERTLGRPAPTPTEPGGSGMARIRQFAHEQGVDGYTAQEMLRTGKWGARLSPAFVEFLQGLLAGWVTDVPGLTRNEQLKALGNGVVPQQAAHAVRELLPDVAALAA